jgi:hypothetical protein
VTDLSRPHFEVWTVWVEGAQFTPGEAWLDLLRLGDVDGVLPVTSYTDRWSWQNAEVADFFTALQRHGHLRAHDKTTWALTYQGQDPGVTEDFELVWKIYPKRVAKQKGFHAYAATRKGRNGDPPVTARLLFEATERYAFARQGEEAEFTLHPATFFGPDERWKEKHKPKTNSQAKGTKGWSRPTSRDLTKSSPPTGTAKSRSRKRTPPTPKPRPKNPRKKSPPKDDPLGSL